MPAVTVLMAVHNAELFLREAVESILGQTFSDFELLVVDDGSTDSTGQILSTYSDSRLRVIQFSENFGLTKALNVGICEAQGVLIARMDGDDVSESRRLELQVAFMRDHPEVALLGTGFVWMDANGRVFDTTRLSTGNAILQDQLLSGNQFCHPSVMVRTDAIRGIGCYREVSGGAAQDYDLWLRLAEQGEIANLPDALLRYRVHESQISVSKLVSQRRAANIYRTLARQRRAGLEEDVDVAQKINTYGDADLVRAVRSDYMVWASRFATMGRRKMAMALLVRAVRLAPADPETWMGLCRHFSGELMSSHLGIMFRWRLKRVFKFLRLWGAR